jgi:hypothetical protein
VARVHVLVIPTDDAPGSMCICICLEYFSKHMSEVESIYRHPKTVQNSWLGDKDSDVPKFLQIFLLEHRERGARFLVSDITDDTNI